MKSPYIDFENKSAHRERARDTFSQNEKGYQFLLVVFIYTGDDRSLP